MGLGEGEGQGQGVGEWHHGLFGCFSNPKNCKNEII